MTSDIIVSGFKTCGYPFDPARFTHSSNEKTKYLDESSVHPFKNATIIDSFLTEPEILHTSVTFQSPNHKNCKRKFYPVLTAGERLEEIRRIEEEKEKKIQERKEKPEIRAAKKVEIEKLKAASREIRAEKKVEREKLKEETRLLMRQKSEKRAKKKLEAEKLKDK
ncbi:unconventional myosin-X-like [Wyeomyia smithii]|uniref:unconventional myosin-X-like n=1 Tax=Wyeomyia smithii TaxID=174621 RepID=UPI002467EF92|nr:unconventional myosin-X-like [Wyeomyia smithii]